MKPYDVDAEKKYRELAAREQADMERNWAAEIPSEPDWESIANDDGYTQDDRDRMADERADEEFAQRMGWYE